MNVEFIRRDSEDLFKGTLGGSRNSWTCNVKSVTVDSCADIDKLVFSAFAVRFASGLDSFSVAFVPLI